MDPKRATKMGDEEMDNPSTQQEQEILSPRRRQRQPNRRFYNDQFVNPVDGEGLTKPADRDSSATATIGSLFSLLPKTNGVPICKRRSAMMVHPKRSPPERQQRSAPPIKKRSPTATLTLSPESKKQTFSAIDTLSSQWLAIHLRSITNDIDIKSTLRHGDNSSQVPSHKCLKSKVDYPAQVRKVKV